MPSDASIARLVAVAMRRECPPSALGDALADLLELQPSTGIAVALDVLSRGPRVKPSCGLLIDPENSALRHWSQRVVAAAVLLNSDVAGRVFGELTDELTESGEFAEDVLAAAGR